MWSDSKQFANLLMGKSVKNGKPEYFTITIRKFVYYSVQFIPSQFLYFIFSRTDIIN